MIRKIIFSFCLALTLLGATAAFGADRPEFFVQLGHSATVHSTAFSPDGKLVASGGMDNNVKLWSTETGREMRTLQGHSSYIYFVSFSPDGTYVVSSSNDNTIRLWDVQSGREIRRIDNALYPRSVAFGPDGNMLFGDAIGNLTIWNRHTGVVKKLQAASGAGGIRAAAFIQGGKYILAAGKLGFIVVDPQTDQVARRFGMKKQSSYDNIPIVFTKDGRYALEGRFNEMILWDTETGNEIRTFKANMNTVNSVAFSPDGRYILSGSANYMLKLWETDTGKEVRSIYHYRRYIYGARYGVTSVAFSSDGRRALAGYKNGAIRVWDVMREAAVIGGVTQNSAAAKADLAEGDVILRVEGKKISSWRDFADGIEASPGKEIQVTLLRNGQELAVRMTPAAAKGKDARGRDITVGTAGVIQGGVCLHNLEGYKRKVSSISLSPEGRLMTVAHDQGTVSLWDVPTGRELRSIPTYRYSSSVAFSPQGRFYLSAGNEDVTVWEPQKAQPVSKFSQDDIGFLSRALAFSPDGRYAAAGGDKRITLYDMEAMRAIRTMPVARDVKTVAVSSDNRTVASGTSMDVILWNAQTGAELRTLRPGSFVYAVDFAPGGRYLVSGAQQYAGIGMDYANTIKLWDVSTGRELRNLGNYKKSVYDARFSRDGRMLLTGGDELLLWNVHSGSVRQTFVGHHDTIWSVAFMPDGKSIASAGDDGTVRIWNMESGKEVAQFVSFAGGEWIVITPEGFFNASPGGAKYLNVRVGSQVYSIDNFYEKFFNPVYVASVLQGREVEATADIRKGILSPPEVRITAPAPGSVFTSDTLTVKVAARDTGGGIDEIRLYHNGKAIGDDTRAVKIVSTGGETIRQYTVLLVDGVNTFRAVGFSRDRTESNPHELAVNLAAPSKDVSLYVLAVGINTYKNPALNLNYAQPDAQSIGAFFGRQSGGLFKKVDVREIYNEQATRENIAKAFNRFRGIHPQDAVLIYLAGHGESLGDKWYFIPHELTYPEREEDVKIKGISSDDLSGFIKNIKAQKILLLVDACKSGAVLIAFRGFEERKALSQLSRSTGVHIVAASTRDQFAAEVKELGHGVFTYTLLEGLGGKAAGNGESITVRKLMGYIEGQLPEITKKYKQEAQYPVVDSRGMDFPLVTGR